MTYEKWQDIKEMVLSNFEVCEEGVDRVDEMTEVEFIIFKKGEEKLKLTLRKKPKVIEKKTIYSKRIGSETKEDYVYDPEQKVLSFHAYLFDEREDRWVEMKGDSGFF